MNAHRQTRREALRRLLSNEHRKYSTDDLMRVGGRRPGARLFELHHGNCGPALHYARNKDERTGLYFYRRTDKAHCTVCGSEHTSPAQTIKLLQAENASLRERLRDFLQE